MQNCAGGKGGQRVGKGDINNWCTTLEPHDRISCVPCNPSAWNTRDMSSKMMSINKYCTLTN